MLLKNSSILVLAITSVLFATGCQKASEKPKTSPAPEQQNDPDAKPAVGKITSIKSSCQLTEVSLVKVTTDAGKTEEKKQTVISTREYSAKQKLTSLKGDFRNYDQTGDFVSSGKITWENDPKDEAFKIDYTFTAKRSSKLEKLSTTVFESTSKTTRIATGRNGYKFKLPDGSTSDTKTTETEIVQRYSDDGKNYKVISYMLNGKEDTTLTNFETQYEQIDKNKTKIVTTLVTPFNFSDTQKIISSEEVCIEETFLEL